MTTSASLPDSIRSLRDPPSSSPAPGDQPIADDERGTFLRHTDSLSSAASSGQRSVSGSQKFPRPAMYTSPGSEDMTRSPRERFDALLASPTSPPTQAQDAAPPERTLSKASAESYISTGSAINADKGPMPSSHISKASQTSQSSISSSRKEDDMEVAAAISSAGSAEAAIKILLKEKRANASRVDQLWKLIEKQRAMVLGLNKDLERALKEKERYKKKLKDNRAMSPTSELELPKSPEPPLIATMDATAGDHGQPSSHDLPFRQARNVASDLQYADETLTPTKADIPSPGEKSRKGPPTPLNLMLSKKPEQVIEVVDGDERSPEIERGRRRTREDDDREREIAAAIEEEERRSRSSKSKSKSKSKQPQAILPPEQEPRAQTQVEVAAPPVVGLPTSPRAPLLGGLQSPMMQPPMGAFNRGPVRPAQPYQPDMMGALKSPGLPMSPRPTDRPVNAPAPRPQAPDAIPLSPRAGLPMSPREPRQAIPLPPSNGQSTTYVPWSAAKQDPASEDATEGPIYKGLVSEQHPQLLLPPNALTIVDVVVDSSRMKPPQFGKANDNEPVFTLAVCSRRDKTQLWRVEKSLSMLTPLTQSLRHTCDFSGKPPDRGLFQGHSPAKVDARRAALNAYFEKMLDTPMGTNAALVVCSFLSVDVIGPRAEKGSIGSAAEASSIASQASGPVAKKEGYLAKRGKQFGGWKARYFILESSELRHYESPGGDHLGTIKLAGAQIAKQTAQDMSEDAEYRHGFMILEPKRKDSASLVRHVLCAESDQERDEWVDALMAHVEAAEDPGVVRTGSVQSKQPTLQSISYDNAVAANAPVLGSVPLSPGSRSTSGSASNSPTTTTYPSISSPVAGGPIQNAQAWGNKAAPGAPREREFKKLFSLKGRNSEDSNNNQSARNGDKRPRPTRPVFGMPLAEAAETCHPYGITVALPAPVYRCIEYLQAKGASSEEGIFRLSGSNIEIKNLKDRFNLEGDVKLLDGQNHDVHAVASLLKLYLRELPESILTRELHLEFLKAIEFEDKNQKAQFANMLVHRLPEANFELLAMLSRFLLDIVHSSSTSKMNSRNVGIIFSPTLNVPAPLISLFISDYSYIFGRAADVVVPDADMDSPTTPLSASSIGTLTPNTAVDDIRSPRKQMFSDLVTPAYNQSTFPEAAKTGFVPMQQVQHQQVQYHAPPPLQPQNAPRPAQTLTQVGESGFGSLNAALAGSPRLPNALTPSSSASSANGGVRIDTTSSKSSSIRNDGGLMSPGMPTSPTAGFGRF